MSYFQPGQQLPAFRLPDSRGHMFNLADYRQRRNVIVLLIDRAPWIALDQTLAELTQAHAAFEEENTIVVAVLNGAEAAATVLQERLALSFALLSDSNGQVHQQLGLLCNQSVPFLVYILDRAGVVVASYSAAESDTMPTVQELLEWVRYIELRCPE